MKADHLKAVVEGDKTVALVTNDEGVRQQASALLSRAQQINRVLNSPAAHPDVRRKAKDSLVLLSKEALALWSIT